MLVTAPLSVRFPPTVPGAQRADPLPGFPAVLLPHLVDLVLHLVLGQPQVLLLPGDVVRLPAGPQEVSND